MFFPSMTTIWQLGVYTNLMIMTIKGNTMYNDVIHRVINKFKMELKDGRQLKKKP